MEEINDFSSNQKSQYIFQSFSKNPILPVEEKQPAILTSGFSFKGDQAQSNTQNPSTTSNSMDVVTSSVQKSIKGVSYPNNNCNDILYSGHFGPKNNISSIESNVNPFQPIQEENCSFLNDDSSFLNILDTKIIDKKSQRNKLTKSSFNISKSFSNICKSITINKKDKKIKSSEELEIEKINREKASLKRLFQINKNNNDKIQKISPLPFTHSVNKSNIVQKPFIFETDKQFLNKKRNELKCYACNPDSRDTSQDNIDISSLSSKLKSISIKKKKLEKENKGSKKLKPVLFKHLDNKNKSFSLDESVDKSTSKISMTSKSFQNYLPLNKPMISIRQAFGKQLSNEERKINSNLFKKSKSFLNKENVKKKMNIISFESLINQK